LIHQEQEDREKRESEDLLAGEERQGLVQGVS
jgi:hypothetical protein